MKRTTLYLEPDLEVRLKLVAMSHKKPMAAIIREALRAYLDQRPKNLPPGQGEFDSGFTDTAERTKEVLSDSGFGEQKD